MFRFVLVLACCQAALAQDYASGEAGPSDYARYQRYQKNQTYQYSGDNSVRQYDGEQYQQPNQQRQYPRPQVQFDSRPQAQFDSRPQQRQFDSRPQVQFDSRSQQRQFDSRTQQRQFDSRPAFESYFGAKFQTTDRLAAKFRNLTKTWTPGSNPKPPSGYVSGVNMLELDKTRLPLGIRTDVEDLILPDKFDARQQWPRCPSLREIRDQGCCGSCWAISAASAMSDRWCIRSKGEKQFSFGAMDLLSCCVSCGQGCKGGVLGPAWTYWVEKGISSGGPLNSSKGCHPYLISACRVDGEEADTPKCSKKCQAGYNVTDVSLDRRYGRVAYSVPNDELRIMEEIYLNGPVQAAFWVYLDFHAYKSGIYRHVYGPQSGGHAVKIIGWGIENGIKYWLIANSWGREWGDNGFFKIIRGENHCGIEENIHAGLPNLRRKPEDSDYYRSPNYYN